MIDGLELSQDVINTPTMQHCFSNIETVAGSHQYPHNATFLHQYRNCPVIQHRQAWTSAQLKVESENTQNWYALFISRHFKWLKDMTQTYNSVHMTSSVTMTLNQHSKQLRSALHIDIVDIYFQNLSIDLRVIEHTQLVMGRLTNQPT